ncbi:hypothetical protein LTR09_011734 [Extremus antarcticus]|uniref:Uncharacterized protein n=1 Tax=Extremus antarcticus TaxID=702011 RepID=A0AAJ0D601_9PEZI|nr:hypothetical protein LTR09_011734 [Extremus antarcticus]
MVRSPPSKSRRDGPTPVSTRRDSQRYDDGQSVANIQPAEKAQLNENRRRPTIDEVPNSPSIPRVDSDPLRPKANADVQKEQEDAQPKGKGKPNERKSTNPDASKREESISSRSSVADGSQKPADRPVTLPSRSKSGIEDKRKVDSHMRGSRPASRPALASDVSVVRGGTRAVSDMDVSTPSEEMFDVMAEPRDWEEYFLAAKLRKKYDLDGQGRIDAPKATDRRPKADR